MEKKPDLTPEISESDKRANELKQQTVRDYIAFFRETDCRELFDRRAIAEVDRLAELYGDIKTTQAICETRIDCPEKNCDFSVVVSEKNGRCSNYWLELDQSWDKVSPPCRYLDIGFLKPDMSADDFNSFIDYEVSAFAGAGRAEKLKPMLRKVLAAIDGRSSKLYQLGAMYGRGENNSLRIFPRMMKVEDNLAMLRELGWKGNFEALETFIHKLLPYCREQYIQIDFDIFEDHISDMIGISFEVDSHQRKMVVRWLKCLIVNNLCILEKAADILGWIYSPAQKEPFIIPDYSHFKFKFDTEVRASKVYLSLECEPRREYSFKEI